MKRDWRALLVAPPRLKRVLGPIRLLGIGDKKRIDLHDYVHSSPSSTYSVQCEAKAAGIMAVDLEPSAVPNKNNSNLAENTLLTITALKNGSGFVHVTVTDAYQRTAKWAIVVSVANLQPQATTNVTLEAQSYSGPVVPKRHSSTSTSTSTGQWKAPMLHREALIHPSRESFTYTLVEFDMTDDMTIDTRSKYVLDAVSTDPTHVRILGEGGGTPRSAVRFPLVSCELLGEEGVTPVLLTLYDSASMRVLDRTILQVKVSFFTRKHGQRKTSGAAVHTTLGATTHTVSAPSLTTSSLLQDNQQPVVARVDRHAGTYEWMVVDLWERSGRPGSGGRSSFRLVNCDSVDPSIAVAEIDARYPSTVYVKGVRPGTVQIRVEYVVVMLEEDEDQDDDEVQLSRRRKTPASSQHGGLVVHVPDRPPVLSGKAKTHRSIRVPLTERPFAWKWSVNKEFWSPDAVQLSYKVNRIYSVLNAASSHPPQADGNGVCEVKLDEQSGSLEIRGRACGCAVVQIGAVDARGHKSVEWLELQVDVAGHPYVMEPVPHPEPEPRHSLATLASSENQPVCSPSLLLEIGAESKVEAVAAAAAAQPLTSADETPSQPSLASAKVEAIAKTVELVSAPEPAKATSLGDSGGGSSPPKAPLAKESNAPSHQQSSGVAASLASAEALIPTTAVESKVNIGGDVSLLAPPNSGSGGNESGKEGGQKVSEVAPSSAASLATIVSETAQTVSSSCATNAAATATTMTMTTTTSTSTAALLEQPAPLIPAPVAIPLLPSLRAHRSSAASVAARVASKIVPPLAPRTRRTLSVTRGKQKEQVQDDDDEEEEDNDDGDGDEEEEEEVKLVRKRA